jgi:hypothetical protein
VYSFASTTGRERGVVMEIFIFESDASGDGDVSPIR